MISPRPSPLGGVSARAAWVAVESQFLGNRETRALYLDAQFRSFSQGDLSVTDYCRRLKRMEDDLCDLGEVVPDRTLVLNLIRGLNERFANIDLHLRCSHPFPSFLEAKDALRLEELTFAQHDTTPTALVAGSSPASACPLHRRLQGAATPVEASLQPQGARPRPRTIAASAAARRRPLAVRAVVGPTTTEAWESHKDKP